MTDEQKRMEVELLKEMVRFRNSVMYRALVERLAKLDKEQRSTHSDILFRQNQGRCLELQELIDDIDSAKERLEKPQREKLPSRSYF